MPELAFEKLTAGTDMAVVTAFFNPCGYANLRRNYSEFRRHLGVPLRTIELSFNGTFEISDALHVNGGPANLLWQKERLLNLVVNGQVKNQKCTGLSAAILPNVVKTMRRN